MDKMVPKVRFKGFTDDWELCKLSDMVKITMGQSPSSKNYTNNSEDYILVQGNADLKNGYVVPRVWTTQVTKTAKKGDLILGVRAPVGDIGKTTYDVVLGRGVAGIKGNEFIFQLLLKMKSNGYWTRYSTGSTFESINSDDIKNATIIIPKNVEQIKVGKLLKVLDNIILLQQRQLDLYKKLKQGLLQKLFPSVGEKVPVMRFANFHEDWEQVQLNEIVTLFSGLTYSPKNITQHGTFVIRSSNIQNGEIIEADNVYVDSKIVTSKNVSIGDIIVVVRNGSRNLIGKHAMVEKMMPDTVIGAFMTGIHSDVPNFTNVLLDTNNFKKEINKNLGATINQITNSNLNKMIFNISNNKYELKKIGSLFNKLDKGITLQQEKLDYLKRTKTAFLQKLFI